MADPFFETIHDGEWNACIGKQGDVLNYVEGYLEAAQRLAAIVVEDRLYGSRDTLALPILYNVRHGLELALKYVLTELAELGLAQAREGDPDHDIQKYWERLQIAKVGDKTTRELIDALEPYVSSLAQIDADGQELRYFETQNGKRSLADKAVVNLPHVGDSVTALRELVIGLIDNVARLRREHVTATRTARLSRRDLQSIAQIVGDRITWKEDSFLERKAEAKARFAIGSAAFTEALHAIEASRELAGQINIESPLDHLSDEQAEGIATRWLEINPPAPLDTQPRIVSARSIGIETIKRHTQAKMTLVKEVIELLSPDEFADVDTIFYIGRDRLYGEEYPDALARTKSEHRHDRSRFEHVDHVLTKTNFLDDFIRGLRKVGRLRLADRLEEMQGAARSAANRSAN